MNLDSLTCPDHGWLGHFGIHEAGHAVAAVVLGFDFVELSIAPGHDVYRSMVLGQTVIGAGLLMPTDNPAEWVGSREDDALTFVLAGSLAEREMFQHFLSGGYGGDLDMWRRGTGRFDAQTEELKPILAAGVSRATALVRENRPAILRVYKLVIDQVPSDGHGGHLGFDEPLTLTYEAIRAAALSA